MRGFSVTAAMVVAVVVLVPSTFNTHSCLTGPLVLISLPTPLFSHLPPHVCFLYVQWSGYWG